MCVCVCVRACVPDRQMRSHEFIVFFILYESTLYVHHARDKLERGIVFFVVVDYGVI